MAYLEYNVTGDFHKLNSWLQRLKKITGKSILDKYGKIGVSKLSDNTPKRTGKTASSWRYEVDISKNPTLSFHNDNFNEGVNIAIIIYTGHVTKEGYRIQGKDYLTPSINSIVNDLANSIWEEVKNV